VNSKNNTSANNWKTGHVDPWWDNSFKYLNYSYRPLKNTHDLVRWINEGYGHLNLNGELYSMPAVMPEYADRFFTLFEWQDVTIAFYRMNTCDALPMHSDSYTSYAKRYNVAVEKVFRAIVFLEDWDSGHYFEIDGELLMPWKAGDWVYWNNNVSHFAGNFGVNARYTMQITGHI